MPNRQFVLGQIAFMSRTKAIWRYASNDFVTGWLFSYDNDRRMGEIEGSPV